MTKECVGIAVFGTLLAFNAICGCLVLWNSYKTKLPWVTTISRSMVICVTTVLPTIFLTGIGWYDFASLYITVLMISLITYAAMCRIYKFNLEEARKNNDKYNSRTDPYDPDTW